MPGLDVAAPLRGLMQVPKGLAVLASTGVIQPYGPMRLRRVLHTLVRWGPGPAGGYQALGLLWPLLNPLYGWTAFTFLSHKVLRWASPFLLLGALLAAAALLRAPLYEAALRAQLAFYGVCAAGGIWSGRGS